jgi:GT2 family glycosyltransferase
MYSEEMDLCYRLRKAGWRLYWVPDAVVVHHGGQSSRQIPTEMFLHLYRSKILYFRKNHGRASALAYKVILALAASARLLITPLAWLAPRARRERNLMLAGRYLRLLATLPAV